MSETKKDTPKVGDKAVASEKPKVAKKEEKKDEDLMGVLQGIATGMEGLTKDMTDMKKRVHDIETGGKEKFKHEAKAEDIAAASEMRKDLDPKVSAIVDEMLGEDFGAEMKPLGDRPGFRFTVIVPERLSDNVLDKRPIRDEETGEYKKDEADNVIFEDFMPVDRRSRIISSTDSYDSIKQHCERVRGYIVSYFQKMNQPLPEFKVK